MAIFDNPFKTKVGGNDSPNATAKAGSPDSTSGVIPANQKTGEDTLKGSEGDDPLLNFESLWQPNTDKEGKVIVKQKGPKSYLPAIDQKAMGEMMQKMDFTKDIGPETLAAIEKGGQEGVQAMLQAMNAVGKRSFMTAFTGVSKMAEVGLQNARQDAVSEIPDHVSNLLTDSQLEGSNPFMKDPAFAPMVKMIKEQYREKYPKATPADINRGVNAYFDALHAKHTGHKNKDTKVETNADRIKAGDPGADWADWLDVPMPAPAGGDSQNQDTNNQ